MKSIGVVSWKGGTGKTTLAFNLAERATHHGIDTTLCDFDPQANALDYFRIRNSHNPDAMQIKGVKGSLSVAGIDTLRRQSAQNQDGLLVCDLPGADAFTLDQALAIMDLLVIPVTASPNEVTVTRRFAAHVMDNNWPAAVVLNNLPPGTARKSQLIEIMEQIGIDVAPVSPGQTIIVLGCDHAWIERLRICSQKPGICRNERVVAMGGPTFGITAIARRMQPNDNPQQT